MLLSPLLIRIRVRGRVRLRVILLVVGGYAWHFLRGMGGKRVVVDSPSGCSCVYGLSSRERSDPK